MYYCSYTELYITILSNMFYCVSFLMGNLSSFLVCSCPASDKILVMINEVKYNLPLNTGGSHLLRHEYASTSLSQHEQVVVWVVCYTWETPICLLPKEWKGKMRPEVVHGNVKSSGRNWESCLSETRTCEGEEIATSFLLLEARQDAEQGGLHPPDVDQRWKPPWSGIWIVTWRQRETRHVSAAFLTWVSSAL